MRTKRFCKYRKHCKTKNNTKSKNNCKTYKKRTIKKRYMRGG